MLEYLILIFAVPLGLILAKTVKREKEIYLKKQYFPTILVVTFLGSIITYFSDKELFLTFLFTFIMTLTWYFD